VVGWYVAGGPGAGLRFNPLNAGVVKDTRLAGSGGKLAALIPRSVQIRAVRGVPNSPAVTAVMLNVTVAQPALAGYATAYPSNTTPALGNLCYLRGRTVSNLMVVKVGADGKINVRSSSSTHMIVDVVGWFGG